MWILRIAHTFLMTNAPYVAKILLGWKGFGIVRFDGCRDCFFTYMEILLSVNAILIHCPPMQSPLLSPSGDLMTERPNCLQ